MRALTAFTPTPQAWDAFVAAHPQAHILQLPDWGALKSQFGWQSEIVALTDSPDADTIVAGAQILYRPLPLKLGTLAYVPKGPLAPADWWDAPVHLAPLWGTIHRTAQKHGARWLKVEAPDTPTNNGPSPKIMARALAQAGFAPSPQTIQPVRTVVIDLQDGADAVLARMKQKTRYNIRLSARKDVTVRRGTLDDIASFNAMMAVTGARDAFGVHAPEYYREAFARFAPQDRAALFIASYNGQDLAGIMVFALGHTAWYFYGASTNEERNRMPTYAAQWAAIEWAMAKGCMQYDMWGVPDEDEATLEAQFATRSDGLWGVYRTKRGWGGSVVRRMPAWDFPYHRPIYALYRLAMRLR
ncbi:MAG: peptidoglycan bridge formation glycyltransferase FemA/FemB family protein [Anaerolineae bacterium]